MRQVRDSLVWLAMILVVAAVVYVTPRLANYVRASESVHGRSCPLCNDVAYHHHHPAADSDR